MTPSIISNVKMRTE